MSKPDESNNGAGQATPTWDRLLAEQGKLARSLQAWCVVGVLAFMTCLGVTMAEIQNPASGWWSPWIFVIMLVLDAIVTAKTLKVFVLTTVAITNYGVVAHLRGNRVAFDETLEYYLRLYFGLTASDMPKSFHLAQIMSLKASAFLGSTVTTVFFGTDPDSIEADDIVELGMLDEHEGQEITETDLDHHHDEEFLS